MTIKIILADDHGIVRAGLRLLINAQTSLAVVGEVANGREAVREVILLHPDIAVLDIAMPELNGIEATRKIHEVWPATQVIILSMYASRDHIYHALQAGARGYVLKEAAGDELIEAIHTVYAGRRHLSPKITEELLNDYLEQSAHGEKVNLLAQLSSREREVLQLVVEGQSSATIAEALFLSPKTIESYRSRLMQKLGITDLPSLVKFAIQQGIIVLE
ncbi:MAG: response regulator transcription factor [Chloroflexi bacterium]|nr:response regulator transcription factor [Chloroflexota bacterium]